jgi:ParB/RepB/Spo0J family partition protein
VAVTLDAGKVGRRDMLFIDPELIVVDDKINGRWQPHAAHEIDDLVASYESEGGQLQPCTIRKLPDSKPQLVIGYRRHAAAVAYNIAHPDKRMQLKCVLIDANEEECLRKNIVENRDRKGTSPMDDAFNQRRLREDHGWADSTIADFYGTSTGYVSTLRKLLGLKKAIQWKVHSGELAINAAIKLGKLPAEAQEKIVAAAEPEPTPEPPPERNGHAEKPPRKSITSAVTNGVREAKIERGEAEPRSLADIRTYFQGLALTAVRPEVAQLGEAVMSYIKGAVSDDKMTALLEALVPEVAR